MKKSKLLWLTFLINFLPAPVRYISQLTNKTYSSADWNWFLTNQQVFTVFGMLFSIILGACYIFGMEYHHHTAAYVYTTPASRKRLLTAKTIAVFLIIIFSHITSFIAVIVFGYLTVNKFIPVTLLLLYFKASSLSILLYFSLTGLIGLIGTIIKKYAVSAALIIGYILMIFPFHLKYSIAICPFMLPAFIYSKIIGLNDIIFSGYKQFAINYTVAAPMLLMLFIIPFIAVMQYVRKADTM